MANNFSSLGTDPFAGIYDNVQAQRSQIAQYALNKAATYWNAKKPDEAIKEFKKVLAFDPQNTDAISSLGKIYQSKGNLTEAIKYFKLGVQADRISVTAHNNLGNAYLQAKQYTDAEKEFKASARMDPINPVADYTLGLLYTQTDRFVEAEAQFNKVAKVSPRDGNIPYSLGVLYNKMGRPEDAAKQLEKALTLKKDFPAANYELGAAYVKMGEIDKAQAQLSILNTKRSSLANDLSFLLNKPKMLYMNQANNRSFIQSYKAGAVVNNIYERTKLQDLDVAFFNSGASSKQVSVAIQFNNEMDITSIMNPSNWEISRANSAAAGYYNNFMPVPTTEVTIPKRPISVTYDPSTREASVIFILTQNADNNATIDPEHLVFKFSGKDASGRQMDTAGDQIDYFSVRMSGEAF